MSGIMFKTNYFTITNHGMFLKSLRLLNHRGPDEEGLLFTDDYSFGHKRLFTKDKIRGHQPMSILNHHIVFDGILLNFDELNSLLIDKVKSRSDCELVLKLLIQEGIDIINKFNGNFSFVYTNNDVTYIVRDQIGIKNLYYTIKDNDIIVSSEIKSILNYGVKPIMTKDEISELITLAPSSSPGHTLFKDIFEVKPGHYLKFSRTGIEDIKYYNLKRIINNYSYEDNVSHLNYLLKDSVKRNIESDVGISSLLSGGLDSSIITTLAFNEVKKLDTYSIDYEGNKEEYKTNSFETSRDEDYIHFITNKNGINHKTVLIDSKTIFDYLKSTVILKDSPGMADIDSSLLFLSKEISNNHKVCLSGECADELFAGYPWFKDLDFKSFPWIRNIDSRIDIVNDEIKNKIDFKGYLNKRFEEVINETPIDIKDDELKIKELKLNYLNIMYFMQSLIKRNDLITSGASLEVRVPFADKRIVEFAYNLPLEQKRLNNMEKQILRDSFKNDLPIEIFKRHKSPYPKSQSLTWHKIIKEEVIKILDNDTPLSKIFNIDKLKEIVINDKELDVPWYGQLMRRDAFLAFIYQIHYWLNEYNIEVIL